MPWYKYTLSDGRERAFRASYDGKDAKQKAERMFGPGGTLERTTEPTRGREVTVYNVDDLHVK